MTAVLFRWRSSGCKHGKVYLVCSDVSKQCITSILNVADLVQIDADFKGWKSVCLNVGQIVGIWTFTARDCGGGRCGRTCIEQVRAEFPRIAEWINVQTFLGAINCNCLQGGFYWLGRMLNLWNGILTCHRLRTCRITSSPVANPWNVHL